MVTSPRPIPEKPFDDVKRVIAQTVGAEGDETSIGAEVGIGSGAVTNFSELPGWLARCQRRDTAILGEVYICVLASAYLDAEPNDLVRGYVKSASTGHAAVNHVSADLGLGLRVLELGIEVPHDTKADWSEVDCTRSFAFGMEATAAGGDLLGLSTLAPGNISGMIAIVAACSSLNVSNWFSAVENASAHPDVVCARSLLSSAGAETLDPLEALRLFGGREVASALGAMVAARTRQLPIVMDGWASVAAFSVLHAINPRATSHVRLAAASDKLQADVARTTGLYPLVGVYSNEGAGCGAAISVSLLKSACGLAAGMPKGNGNI